MYIIHKLDIMYKHYKNYNHIPYLNRNTHLLEMYHMLYILRSRDNNFFYTVTLVDFKNNPTKLGTVREVLARVLNRNWDLPLYIMCFQAKITILYPYNS